MDCKDFNIKIQNYIDNLLSETESIEIQKHLETCNKCKKTLFYLQKTENFIADEKQINVTNFIATKIIAKKEKITQKQQYFIKVFAPTFAVIIIFLGVFLGLNFAKYINNQQDNLTVFEKDNTDVSDQYVINDISYNDYYFYSNQ